MDESHVQTIADVAKAAGVSISTVSRILNGKQDVAPATRERVQQVIKALGFAPHAQAKRLRAGKTRNIALLFPLKYPGNLPYNALDVEFILGAAAAAAEQEFLFSLLTAPVTEQSLVSLYRSAQVDGLVLMQIHTQDWRVDLLRQNNYPFVMIGHCDDNTGLNFVDLDFEAAVVEAFDYLLALGHQHIGFLALPQEMLEQGYGPGVRQWAGYQKALEANGLSPLHQHVDFNGQDVFEATLALLNEQPQLTAIITFHAMGFRPIIEALKSRGRNVPDDCSLIANMTEQLAELSTPPITRIDFPSRDMGHKAVEMLIRTLEGELVEPEQMLIPPKLIIRDSVARLN
jgi:DNA-binding LacI/PurR family transcriptional regulator